MTIDDMERRLAATTLKSGGMLFEPITSNTWFEVPDARDIQDCLVEIKNKLPLAQVGLVPFTACEKMMLRLLVQHCQVAHSVPQGENHGAG